MNALLRAPLAPTVTLTAVPQTIDCPTCDGLERVTTGQAADGSIHDKPCPNPQCYLGFVKNPDWEPGLMVCRDGHALLPGDSCQLCGADYLMVAA